MADKTYHISDLRAAWAKLAESPEKDALSALLYRAEDNWNLVHHTIGGEPHAVLEDRQISLANLKVVAHNEIELAAVGAFWSGLEA